VEKTYLLCSLLHKPGPASPAVKTLLSSGTRPQAGPEASSPSTDESDSVKMKVISLKIGLSKTS